MEHSGLVSGHQETELGNTECPPSWTSCDGVRCDVLYHPGTRCKLLTFTGHQGQLLLLILLGGGDGLPSWDSPSFLHNTVTKTLLCPRHQARHQEQTSKARPCHREVHNRRVENRATAKTPCTHPGASQPRVIRPHFPLPSAQPEGPELKCEVSVPGYSHLLQPVSTLFP